MPKRNNKLSVGQYVLIVGDFLLLAILLWNLWQMYLTAVRIGSVVNQQILSADPSAFAAQLVSDAVPVWAWALEFASLAVTAFLIVAWLMPKLRVQLPLSLINTIWLLLWLAYFVFLFILAIVVASSVLGFT